MNKEQLKNYWLKIKNASKAYWDNSSVVRRRVIVGVVILFSMAVIGITHRIYSDILLYFNTQQQILLNVATVVPQSGPKVEQIVLPGTIQAWHEATIYARTNGYISAWHTDIGAVVKTNDLLAVIDAPEIDAQLLQAQADLKVVEADDQLAQTTDARWKILLKTESVSQQDADEKASAAQASQARVAAARANLAYLEELVKFQKVVAPFHGVITARNIDIGSLITAGSNNTETPLFKIVQSERLRLYLHIPQKYTPRLSPNMQVELYFNEYPDKTYNAVLLSTAEGIDRKTRTLLAEFLVDNANYELLPGSYTEVHLLLPVPDNVVRVPVNTLLFRAQGLQVGVVNEQGVVTLKPIVIGRDFGDEVEIIKGLTLDENVIVNPSDALQNGQTVNVVNKIKPADKKL